jgi:hypothetical protein
MVEDDAVIAKQWLGKHISAAMTQHTTEELLEAVFLCGQCQGHITRTNRES